MTKHNTSEPQDELESFFQHSSQPNGRSTSQATSSHPADTTKTASTTSSAKQTKSGQHKYSSQTAHNSSDEQNDPLAEFYDQQEQNQGIDPVDVNPESTNSAPPSSTQSSQGADTLDDDLEDQLTNFYRQQEQSSHAGTSFTSEANSSTTTNTATQINPESYFHSAQQVSDYLRQQHNSQLEQQYQELRQQNSQLANSIPHQAQLTESKLGFLTGNDKQLSVRVSKFLALILKAFCALFVLLLVTNLSSLFTDTQYADYSFWGMLIYTVKELLYYGIPAVLFGYSARLTSNFAQELGKAYALEQRHYCNQEQTTVAPQHAEQINLSARQQSTKVLSNVMINREVLAQQPGQAGVNLLQVVLCGTESNLVTLNHFAEVSFHAKTHPELAALDVVDYYEEKFLSQLDAQAQEQIIKIAKRISVTTGLSQWSLIDMLLIYIAGMKLIERIAKIYDIQMSAAQRLLLARRILVLVAVGGITEEFTDSATELLSNSLVAKYLGDVTQGLSNGVLMMRFGLKTIELLRPLPYQAKRPTIVAMLKEFMKFSKKSSQD